MEKKNSKKSQIIIIEDDKSIQKTLFLILKNEYNVDLFSTGEEALKKIKNGSIALIITDFKLPGMNGLEVIEIFRKYGYKGKTILISAYPDLLDSKVIEKLGVDFLFIKPLDLNKLTTAIKFLLL